MSQKVREELLPRLRQKYSGRGKKGRGVLLDEVCEQFGHSRKHAIKLVGSEGWMGRRSVSSQKQAAGVWGGGGAGDLQDLEGGGAVLRQDGRVAGAMAPGCERRYGRLKREVRSKVLNISAAQIDRLLARRKVREGKGRCGTKPGELLKKQIPIRTNNWEVDRPAYLEADTVAHCGSGLEGNFVWSVTYTDIASGWTVNRIVWNKGAKGIVAATREVEGELPFAILGFDCDNGSEFLNWHLVRYFQDRPKRVGFTRSRPHHKDDNGHVEEKNWTRVRQLLASVRQNRRESSPFKSWKCFSQTSLPASRPRPIATG